MLSNLEDVLIEALVRVLDMQFSLEFCAGDSPQPAADGARTPDHGLTFEDSHPPSSGPKRDAGGGQPRAPRPDNHKVIGSLRS